MNLSASFKHTDRHIRSNEAIPEAALMERIPSLFATEKHPGRSIKYTFIPTLEILKLLAKEGFYPFQAAQTACKDPSRLEHARHMVRFRHASQIAASDHAKEIILVGSHGSEACCHQLIGGVFEFVCTNSLVVGETFNNVKVRHSGNVKDDFINAAYTVLEDFNRIDESRSEMLQIQLKPEEQIAFAKAALSLRYEPEDTQPEPLDILRIRRRADADSSLWKTFNRVQENMIQGGVPRRSNEPGVRATRTRKISSIAENTKLNKALWSLAEAMRELRA